MSKKYKNRLLGVSLIASDDCLEISCAPQYRDKIKKMKGRWDSESKTWIVDPAWLDECVRYYKLVEVVS